MYYKINSLNNEFVSSPMNENLVIGIFHPKYEKCPF